MLTISRRLNERVFIGDSIIVKVVEINPDQVKLSIQAPRSMVILREEVWEKTRRKKEPLTPSG